MAGRLLRGQVGDGQGRGMVRWVLGPLNRARSTRFVGYHGPAVTGCAVAKGRIGWACQAVRNGFTDAFTETTHHKCDNVRNCMRRVRPCRCALDGRGASAPIRKAPSGGCWSVIAHRSVSHVTDVRHEASSR